MWKYVLRCPWTRQLSWDVLADAGFLCDEAAVLRDTIKRTFYISSNSKVVFRGWYFGKTQRKRKFLFLSFITIILYKTMKWRGFQTSKRIPQKVSLTLLVQTQYIALMVLRQNILPDCMSVADGGQPLSFCKTDHSLLGRTLRDRIHSFYR